MTSSAPPQPAQLAATEITAEEGRPRRWVWFLHGFLGRGENWLSFARRLARARTDLGCLLVDLRLHGDSQDLSGPHTMEAVADDLERLASARGVPEVVVGHSFGGRAALCYAARKPRGLGQLWVLDAAPATSHRPGGDTTARVLSALRGLPATFKDRRSFVAELGEHDVPEAIAMWLAKNLVRAEDGLRLGLQLGALSQLLSAHDASDCWPFVESPRPDLDLRFVLSGHGSVVSGDDRQRLQAQANRGQLTIEHLPKAGHWLHVDDPDGLHALFDKRLPR